LVQLALPQPPSVALSLFQFSDTGLNYMRPGFDEDPAVLVVGVNDPHLGVDLRLVCGSAARVAVMSWKLATRALTSPAASLLVGVPPPRHSYPAWQGATTLGCRPHRWPEVEFSTVEDVVMKKTLAVLGLVGGLMYVPTGLYFAVAGPHPPWDWDRATGIVTEVIDPDSDDVKTSIRFETEDGIAVDIVSDHGEHATRRGDEVAVFYLPEEPTTAETSEDIVVSRTSGVVMAFVGAILLLFSGRFFFKLRRRRRTDE
jgi:hypothetical protein